MALFSGCMEKLLKYRNIKFKFKIILQNLPNIACSGFGLRLFLMGSFFVEFRPLAKSVLGSPNQ